jgi:hypothetical protein
MESEAKEIGPEGDFCAEINALLPGEELVLLPGEYRGPCVIRRGGSAEAPTVIRGKDPSARPRIRYLEDKSNVLNVAASHITLRGLAFGPTRPAVDAIRVLSGDFVAVEECEFDGLGGIALVANTRSVRGLAFRRNLILNSRTTAVYLGCHDGAACVLEDALVEGNYIQDVDAPEPSIGYGIQIKLNSSARIRDNIIRNTKGPGIMVYGATDPDRASVVERNAVEGSRRSAAIVVGGGPAIVRNNLATHSAQGGIQLEDYGRRGLLRGILIANNTVYGNSQGGITAPPDSSVSAIQILNNAVHTPPGTPAYPTTRKGLLSLGNMDCGLIQCFRDPTGGDFSPAAASPLIGAGVSRPRELIPGEDFSGSPRGPSPSVGAIERPSGPIPQGLKSLPR